MDFKKITESLRPAKEEEREANDAIKAVQKIRISGAQIFPGGSFAKGTRITGMHDVDLFAAFDYKKYKGRKDISDILEKKLSKEGLKFRRIHGSRDYFEIKKGKLKIELVPILGIKNAEKSENITDISPLHTKWVRRNIKKAQADEVRLLKAFCIAQGCYGAESHIRGLSGYACEILIANYKTFTKTINAISKWKDKTIIDAERHYKTGSAALSIINASKTQSPLIIVDPVQKSRNVTASLSHETHQRLQNAAKLFVKKPSESFFVRKKKTAEDISKEYRRKKIIVIEAVPLDGKEDIVLTKILKIKEHIERTLSYSGFTVYCSGIEWEQNPLIWIETDKEIPAVEIVPGPPMEAKEHVMRFRKAHNQAFTKGKKIFAKVKRKHTKPSGILNELARKDHYIIERAKKVIIHD
ncbi:CCA tRNA nucleotidyltransferase [Candidatus Woesearchaeota archaeon]|nr:CCA tRNA nucleotidyltransferase [Candidatus Woesearchaeota archaeon]